MGIGMAEEHRPCVILTWLFGDDLEKWTPEYFEIEKEVQDLLERGRSQADVKGYWLDGVDDSISNLLRKYQATIDNSVKGDQPEASIQGAKMTGAEETSNGVSGGLLETRNSLMHAYHLQSIIADNNRSLALRVYPRRYTGTAIQRGVVEPQGAVIDSLLDAIDLQVKLPEELAKLNPTEVDDAAKGAKAKGFFRLWSGEFTITSETIELYVKQLKELYQELSEVAAGVESTAV